MSKTSNLYTNGSIICQICNRHFTTTNPFCVHLRKSHNMDAKTYYDKYYKDDNEGICLVCKKPTLFNNLTKGYNPYCSRECANHSQARVDKIKQTTKEKYGVSCVLKRSDIREKCEKAANSIEARQKAKETSLKHFGVEHPMKSSKVKDKIKETCLERYGVEYSLQSDQTREKSKQTCLEKYGVDHPWKSTQLRQKQIEEFCLQNNLIPLSELKLYMPNNVLSKFKITPIEYKNKYFIDANIDVSKLIDYSNKLLSRQGTVIEKELDIWLSKLGITHKMRDFSTIAPLQLDCYIQDKKIAIEIDGIYWHSYNHTKDKNKSLIKTDKCIEKDIRLLHFTDIEWNTKTDICKSIILSALNIYDNVIYARKCEVKQITSKEAKAFLDENHIDGYVNASYHLGLLYNNEIVQLISIGKSRYKRDEYELLRMCSKLNTRVIGGFSKLLKHQPYKDLISYVDRSKFTGNGYISAGFTLVDITKPNYYYYLGSNKISRISAQKHKLSKLLGDKFDPNKTEAENMMNAGYLMLYDCGNLKMKYN